MSIGSRIKERREELKITQVELSKMVGVSKGSIGNYESGVSAPNEKILYKLFSALKCDANYLYQDDLQVISNENEFKISVLEKNHIKNTILKGIPFVEENVVETIQNSVLEIEEITLSE